MRECNVSRPPAHRAQERPWWAVLGSGHDGVFVDYVHGDDRADGTLAHPLKTVARALEIVAAIGRSRGAKETRSRMVILRGGVHHLTQTLELTTAHDGLLLTQFCPGGVDAQCEEVWLSGGVPLGNLRWNPHNVTPPRNIWSASLARVPRAAIAVAGGQQSSLHYLADAEGATELDRARWPNRRPSDGTIDRPSLLDITSSSAVWLQKESLARADAKRVVSPSVPRSVTTEFNEWLTGVGGECTRFEPPAAWICNPNATGGGKWFPPSSPHLDPCYSFYFVSLLL